MSNEYMLYCSHITSIIESHPAPVAPLEYNNQEPKFSPSSHISVIRKVQVCTIGTSEAHRDILNRVNLLHALKESGDIVLERKDHHYSQGIEIYDIGNNPVLLNAINDKPNELWYRIGKVKYGLLIT